MVKKDVLVSILIPCFNSSRYLEETLKSALDQTWEEKEIIVVDDGSTDKSIEIANSFRSDNVKVYKQKNQGASCARNYAFNKSSGEYIQFLDSDDLLDPYKIENQLRSIEQGHEKYILSSCFRNFYEGLESCDIMKKDSGFKNFERPIDWLVEAAWGRAMFPPLVWLTPRKMIEIAGPWNESLSYNDDPEFFSRVLLSSKGILFCKDSLSYYRRGVSYSLGSRKDQKARESELESLNLVTRHMLEYENSHRVREACSYRYRKLVYSLYPEHKDLIDIAEEKIRQLGIIGNFNFGNGITNKLGKILGWKKAKLIRQGFYRLRKYF